MNLNLKDLVLGVESVENTDDFPFESMPPQGVVTVRFATGAVVEMMCFQPDYYKAKEILEDRKAAKGDW
jgi:hypothetical protein